jgi:hypothetical protein
MTVRHPPRPSIWPAALALGVSIACAGVITHWVVLAAGVLLTVLAISAWVVDMARER